MCVCVCVCVCVGGGGGIVNKIFFYPLPHSYLWEYKLAQGISVISKYKPYWLATGSPVGYLAAFFLRVRVRVNILNWLNSTDAIVPLFFIHVFVFLFAVSCLGFIWRNCRRHLLSSEERWQGHSKQVGSFFSPNFFLWFFLLPRLFNPSAVSYCRYKHKTQVEHVSLISHYRRWLNSMM